MPESKKPHRSETFCTISVKVIPRSSKLSIESQGGLYKVKLTSPPVDGAANKQLVRFLSEKLSIPSRNIEIVSGMNSRTKRVKIRGKSEAETRELLEW